MTTFHYELGDATAPRGHALLAFRSEGGDAGIWATYLVVPPIVMDFAKYLPPMLASLAPMASMGGSSSVPMPPVPERMDSIAAVRRLALARGDDLLDAGAVDVTAMEQMMLATAEVAQRYHDAYVSHLRTIPEPSATPVQVLSQVDEDIAVYRAMSEGDLLGELSKLVGKLRYAALSSDQYLAEEAERQIHAIGSLLPPKYRIDDLLGVARERGERAERLTSLRLDRCYKLLREEYEALPQVEAQIRELGGG
ncbi:MAG TPA: hypothetical protein VGP33_16680 [Chloroflexota bacterium]|jgi:hypothetical protein|nr:hypothetical protein [Chloroflexota bacterium]